MTREEASTALGDRNCLLWGMSKEEQKYYSEALDMAISALFAEPCEDCISRESILNAITEIDDHCNMDIYTNEVRELVNDLPSVQPIRPKGEWILDKEHSYTFGIYKCSNCQSFGSAKHYHFCPNCGADMRGDK